MSQPAILVNNLVKVYRERTASPVRALDGLSLRVEEGEIFGLLGRNGAGKTTLLRVLTTLIRPTSGDVSVCGHDVVRASNEVRRNICVVLQETAVELYLSVQDNLQTYGRFQGISRTQRSTVLGPLMEQFGLAEHANRKVIDLSGGLRRRIQVAKVFMVDRPVVFLDEPTTGMDPISKRATLDAIREQARKGRTIVLTTHLLHEAEELCDTIAILDRGKSVATGDLQAIKNLVSPGFDVSITFERLSEKILEELRRLPSMKFATRGNTVEMTVRGTDGPLLQSLGRIAAMEKVLDLEVTGASLEDVFLELLGTS